MSTPSCGQKDKKEHRKRTERCPEGCVHAFAVPLLSKLAPSRKFMQSFLGVLEFQEYYNRDHNLTYIWTHPLLEFSPSAQELMVSLAAFDLKEKS